MVAGIIASESVEGKGSQEEVELKKESETSRLGGRRGHSKNLYFFLEILHNPGGGC